MASPESGSWGYVDGPPRDLARDLYDVPSRRGVVRRRAHQKNSTLNILVEFFQVLGFVFNLKPSPDRRNGKNCAELSSCFDRCVVSLGS